MTNYFGKGCEYFIGQWERDAEYEAYFYNISLEENYTPILRFCNHKDNSSHYEGNCCEKLCPLKQRAMNEEEQKNYQESLSKLFQKTGRSLFNDSIK